MMKAVLVIDVPDKYKDKDIFVLHEIYTKEKGRYERIEEYKERFVKIKPLPNKIERGYPCEKYDEGYSDGWDECIDEILGEEKRKQYMY